MTKRWKIGAVLLALAMPVCACLVLLGLTTDRRAYLKLNRSGLQFDLRWEEREPSGREEISLSFEVNNYYWETREVYYFNIFDLANSGKQKRDILIVDLTVTNESERRVSLVSWYVIDAKGERFESTIFGNIPLREDISIEVIRPRATIRGKVAFEVPRGHLPLWIRCADYTAEAKIQ